MDLSNIFWNSSLEELKRGFIEEPHHYVCLLCGEKFEKGIIYPLEGTLYEAEKYTKVHIKMTHGSVFQYLISLNKKMTGLTDHQNQLLRLFYQGKSDTEIQEELSIGSSSTIRHHRFAMKEKERQAKIFLALMELLKEKDFHAPIIVPPHKTATMVDERYQITESEQEKIIQKYFSEKLDGRLKQFPPREKQRLVILREIVHKLDDKIYSEAEINQCLEAIYDDYVLIRRYLIEYGLLDRKKDGSQYWLKK